MIKEQNRKKDERQIVDDIVEVGAVDVWKPVFDERTPGEDTVGRIDDGGADHPEKGFLVTSAEHRKRAEKRRERAARRVDVDEPGREKVQTACRGWFGRVIIFEHS